MELSWWNQKTYTEVCQFLLRDRACAICNATGTGKTSVIAAVIHDYAPKGNVLVIAPRDAILQQYKQDLYALSGYTNLRFISYQKLAKRYQAGDLEQFAPLSLIVCDELHRAGAPTWSVALNAVLEQNPDSKLLGASATPKRLDQIKVGADHDMVDILFDGNRAGNISLEVALREGILPRPTYVATLMDLGEDLARREHQLVQIEDEGTRKKLRAAIREAEINWEASSSIRVVFSRFLSGLSDRGCGKILVFCKTKAHISEVRKAFDPALKDTFAGLPVVFYEYHTDTSELPFKKFKAPLEGGGIQVLYSIDKFNEGVHIHGLDAIIMVRETVSEVIYYQQIGRALSMGSTTNPIIIDLVDNASRVRDFGLWKRLLKKGNTSSRERVYTGDTREKEVCFYNYVEDAINLFHEMDQQIFNETTHEYQGERGTFWDLARLFNKPCSTIYSKITLGMSFEEAMDTTGSIDPAILEYEGVKGSLYQLCNKFHRTYELVKWRMDRGQSLEQAMIPPSPNNQ